MDALRWRGESGTSGTSSRTCSFSLRYCLARLRIHIAAVADRVEEMSGQMIQSQRMVQQIIDNNKPAAAEAASNFGGPGPSARERQMQKLELGNDVALWT